MGYILKWRPKAIEELKKLPKDIAKRIIKRVELSRSKPKHFLEKLVGDPGFKIRAGNYRAIIDIVEENFEKFIFQCSKARILHNLYLKTCEKSNNNEEFLIMQSSLKKKKLSP